MKTIEAKNDGIENSPVIYHNKLNKLQLSGLTEIEQNILFGILVDVREGGDGKIEIKADRIRQYLKENKRDYKEMFDILTSLREKFFKLDFTYVEPYTDEQGRPCVAHITHNLFQTFELHAVKDNPNDGWDMTTNLTRIVMETSPKFAFVLQKLDMNFTRFELAEFVELSGRYTKTLYRLLKQYRNTGLMRMKWDEFMRVMDIPKNYQQCDIDKRILKPAIKELSAERNLFEQARIPFRKLSYTKIKGKGRGRGGQVIDIEFRFTPETIKEIEVNENNERRLIIKTEQGTYEPYNLVRKSFKSISNEPKELIEYRNRILRDKNGADFKLTGVFSNGNKCKVRFINKSGLKGETEISKEDLEKYTVK